MKKFFAGTLCALMLMSVCAWKIQHRETQPGKLPLVWVTGDSYELHEQINLFNRRNPKYQLMLDPNTGGAEKVIVQSIAGVGPDLFDCLNPGQLEKYVKSGVAWDITDEIAKMGIDIDSDVWQSAKGTCVHEGRVYGFPGTAGASAIWYNKEIFDKYGVPYPKPSWTWEDFVSTARRLTIRGKDGRIKQYGVLCARYNWTLFIRMGGGRFFTPDGGRCVVDSPGAIAGLQAMHDLFYKYHVAPTPAEAANMASEGGWAASDLNQFGAEKAAMTFGALYWLTSLDDFPDLRAGVVDVPLLKNRVSIGHSKATFINSGSPRRKEALAFLRFMSGREYNETINRQGIGMSPFIKYSRMVGMYRSRQYVGEEFASVSSRIMGYAEAIETSPFVSNSFTLDAISNQAELMRNGQKTAEEALGTAARQINEEMLKNLEIDPSLRARYNELTGRNRK